MSRQNGASVATGFRVVVRLARARCIMVATKKAVKQAEGKEKSTPEESTTHNTEKNKKKPAINEKVSKKNPVHETKQAASEGDSAPKERNASKDAPLSKSKKTSTKADKKDEENAAKTSEESNKKTPKNDTALTKNKKVAAKQGDASTAVTKAKNSEAKAPAGKKKQGEKNTRTSSPEDFSAVSEQQVRIYTHAHTSFEY